MAMITPKAMLIILMLIILRKGPAQPKLRYLAEGTDHDHGNTAEPLFHRSVARAKRKFLS
jgi:hypothetical protein